MTKTIHEMTSQTSVGVHLLWAYCHPDLAQKSIDDLFATWGNAAKFSWGPFVSYEVRLVATRMPDDNRTPMIDVIQAKADMETFLAMAVDEFAAEQRQRPGNAWIWEKNDQTRAESLAKMTEAA